MKKSIFQMEQMLICQINQKNVCFVITGIFQIRTLAMDHIFVMDAIIQCKNAINLKILLLFMLKKSAYRIYFLYMSKREAKKLMNNSNLAKKKGVLLKKINFYHYV